MEEEMQEHEVESGGEEQGLHVQPSGTLAIHSFPPSAATMDLFPSLFPVAAAGSKEAPNTEAPSWLSLSSFSESLLPPRHQTPIFYQQELEEDEDIKGRASNSKQERPEYKVLSSSTDDRSTDTEDKEHKAVQREIKRKRRRKRRKEEEEKKKASRTKDLKWQGDASKIGTLKGLADRKASTGIWADKQANLSKDYYFDTHGDRDNLAFGSLYRMDVARYQLYKSPGVLGNGLKIREYGKFKTRLIDLDGYDNIQDDGSGGRYWSVKFVSMDKKRNLKRLHITSSHSLIKGKEVHALVENFTPLEMQQSAEGLEREESWEEYIVRKTRLLNEMTRERPQDESLWIDFAKFQDELVNATHKKVLIQATIDKKIAILERSLDCNPESEDLLLLYLEACSKRDDTSLLLSKWETAVSKHPQSYRVWRDFIRFHSANFSSFSVSSLRKVYGQAIQSFIFGREQLRRENKDKARGISYESKILEAEQALVSLFVNLCRLEWQTGHHELAIGLFQAELEFALLCPAMQLSEKNKHRLFEDFWNSGALRVGEQGSVGWTTWLSMEEEQIQKARASNPADEVLEEPGGWIGWSEPQGFADKSSKLDEVNIVNDIEDADDLENIEDEASQEEDDATLLQKLGLNLDIGEEAKVQDSRIWKRWSDKELCRDTEQWLPLHSKSTRAAISATGGMDSEGDDEDLERMVLYEDVREFLFSLDMEQARLELVSQFIHFCDGPFPQWCSSNSSSSTEHIETSETLRGPVLEQILDGLPDKKELLKQMFGGLEWFSESNGRTTFVRNSLFLLRSVFPNHQGLQKALLTTEGLEETKRGDNKKGFASRALAKKLLKNSRQDITLWTTYACMEAEAGNLEAARKVFDTSLMSLSALPTVSSRLDAPILYLAYAEAELDQDVQNHLLDRETEGYRHRNRALYILYFLGSGDSYLPTNDNHSLATTQLLKARQGFCDHLQKLRRKTDLDDRGIALIVCAALFEELNTGWEAAARVFEEGFAISLPGKRQHSIQFELLFCRYVAMLEDHKGPVKPGHLRSVISQGLALYPTNAKLISSYIRSVSQLASTNALRRFFDNALQKYPTTLLYIFALSCELWRPGAGPRTHNLFERALESGNTHQSVLIWRCYLAYELQVRHDPDAARRVFFRAIHACPWSKLLWLDGFQKMSKILTAKEQADFLDIMRDKELRIRTDVYEILLEEVGET
ncbi:hypothetical protein O6H91_19G013800 [Diphasiastrum complanatum]|uniref:Uncharacterized protein n=1 Tax=Diphasiastrum complanatum TaxID=34168 RepID=A0ACC2ASU9_DIPCM|nr:hypothetical protein O6H91_19G013800 [Diphasiastrum complanatum]